MIEQEMVFALGFLTAGLLALACLPAVWRRALRLTMRRLRQLVPLSMEEISAERDGLRAGFAVDRRRLEQRIEAVEEHRAKLMVLIGHRDGTVARQQDALAAARQEIGELTGALDETTRELRDMRGVAGSAAVALHDLTGLAERRFHDLDDAKETAAALRAAIDGQRAAIASLETRIVGLEAHGGDVERSLAIARANLDRALQATMRVEAERDAAVAAGTLWRAERDDLAREAERLGARAEEAERRVASLVASRPAGEDDLALLRQTLREVADGVLRLTEGAGGTGARESGPPP